MAQTGWGYVSVEEVVGGINVSEFTSISDVADEDGLHLSYCCDWNCDGDSCSVNLIVNDLNLEGWVTSEYLVWGNLETVEECWGLDCALEICSEWK